MLCNNNFQSKYAFLKTNTVKYEEYNGVPISIDTYQNNEKLKSIVNKQEITLCCKNGHKLKPYTSKKIRCHFKHVNNNDESGGPMTNWHSCWQGKFSNFDMEVKHKKVDGCIRNRIADVLIRNIVLEFQHSYIKQSEVEERVHDYNRHNRSVHWIVDCNDSIKVDYMNVSNTFMITFVNDFWKYQSFVNLPFIFLHHKENIYKVTPNDIKSNMIDVYESKSVDVFEDAYVNDYINTLWEDHDLPQCTLYHNQRGAGCGKTYESIQLLSNDERFKHKKTFIYLTKAHSAKEVIYNEFKQQYQEGKLNIEEVSDECNHQCGKQYKFTFVNSRNSNECIVIMGTIDSFMYALGNKNNKSRNFFEGLIESIKEGHLEANSKGMTRYARNQIYLNKECLILIDEAQDLDKNVIESVAQIMRSTYIDVFIIGDKLQSIWGENNIYTYLEHNDLPRVKKLTDIGENKVRRFHNVQFIDFVNNVIDFNKYNLHEITSICDGKCIYEHEDDINPITLLQHEVIYSNDTDNKKINHLVDKIIGYLKKEIDQHNYLPNNFMFIFPIMKNNQLANILESKLQEFWIKKFQTVDYQMRVLQKHEYWKERINNGEFYKFSYLHKSDEGKPINVKESEHATRILSIHSSKGLGCEVVFLLGVTEQALKCFSKDTSNLVYDSLLHVAITRQKKRLYIGIVDNGDDIVLRFAKTSSNVDIINTLKLNSISSFIKVQDICNYAKLNHYDRLREEFQNIFTKMEKTCCDNCDVVDKKCSTIDWGHHVIRYCVFFYSLMFNVVNDQEYSEYSDNKQYFAILKSISELPIKKCFHLQYYDELRNIVKNRICESIPVLALSSNDNAHSMYSEYYDIIHETIVKMQKKIKIQLKKSKIPSLCPLEMILIVHVMKVCKKGIYNDDITIMDIYSIICSFHKCWNLNQTNHTQYSCKCDKHFSKPLKDYDAVDKDIIKSITLHHDIVGEISKKYKHFKILWRTLTKNETIVYNIEHQLQLASQNLCEDFTVWNPCVNFIGNSKSYVVYFIIKPELNKLNIYDVVIDCIFNVFLIRNSPKDTPNFTRFNDKKVMICIYTFSKTEPIWFEFDTNALKKENITVDVIKDYLFLKYSKYNQKVIDRYNYLKQNRDDRKTSGLDMLINEIDNIIPPTSSYVKNFLVIQKEKIKVVDKEEQKNLISLNNLNIYLQDRIIDYLYTKDDENYDY
jgi:hypothetical protein